MRYILLGYYDSRGKGYHAIINGYMNRKDADQALSWMRVGGFIPFDAYKIVKPTKDRGVFRDINSKITVQPVHGAMTKKAFDRIYDAIWGMKK